MKSIKYYIALSVAALALWSCNDSFLDKYPQDTQTEATAFKTYANFKTFSWGFYDVFTDSNNFMQGMQRNQGRYIGDVHAGYLSTYATTDPNQYRTGTAKSPEDGGGWDFKFVRRCNLMLSNIDQSEMSDEDKEHWRSVGYFFRAYNYMELISRFGDVPWIEEVIKEDDTDIIYGKRTPRKTVADNVLADLRYAETHIKAEGDGANTINPHVVRALMSRFCLFEGTWRKYHGLGDETPYLDECIRVSELLAAEYPTVASNYDALNNSQDLSTYPGMILYKQYLGDVLMHNAGYRERTSSSNFEMPKYTVESYLCANGKPIRNPSQDLYDGDRTMYDEFRNRDRRLLFTVVPPYCMHSSVVGGMNPPDFTPVVPAVYNNSGFYNAPGVDLMEYAELLKELLPSNGSKRLPVFNWSGTMNWISPNILGPGQAPMASRTGYYLWKFYNLWDNNSNQVPLNTSDRPIFWIEEVLLNLAEARWEKGQFDQSVADATINKLRPRAGVADMVVSQTDAGFDPDRDPTVDPVLWEIRRERMVELMGEGFGFQDIRRWKKGPWYINRPQMGVFIKKSDYVRLDNTGAPTATVPDTWKNLVTVNPDSSVNPDEGYLRRFDNPVKLGQGWKDAYYLFPIPLKQLVLNPEIEPNPGWD